MVSKVWGYAMEYWRQTGEQLHKERLTIGGTAGGVKGTRGSGRYYPGRGRMAQVPGRGRRYCPSPVKTYICAIRPEAVTRS